jgi:hypothetical protein
MKRRIRSFFARPGSLLLVLVIVLAAGWLHRAFVFADSGDASSPESQRTVVVGLTETPSEAGELHGTLVAGDLPEGAHEAEVLSDRDCAPDSEGISHCLNELDLGTNRITIRHHHRMGEVPCLRPGETVTVMNGATYKDRQTS